MGQARKLQIFVSLLRPGQCNPPLQTRRLKESEGHAQNLNLIQYLICCFVPSTFRGVRTGRSSKELLPHLSNTVDWSRTMVCYVPTLEGE